jgi:hypothetical protein
VSLFKGEEGTRNNNKNINTKRREKGKVRKRIRRKSI